MAELPLFPLNSVLFPGMPLQLHIFEERYKTMINRCIDEKSPFGVVLIESGLEALGPLAEPHLIGTTAHITQVQHLPYGRMNILAVGKDRFRINEFYNKYQYLSGQVDLINFNESTYTDEQHVDRLRQLFMKYLQTLEQSGQARLMDKKLPDDAATLAYLSAYVLQIEMPVKQTLLEVPSLSQLMTRLISLYRHEITMAEIMFSPPDFVEESQGSDFSPN